MRSLVVRSLAFGMCAAAALAFGVAAAGEAHRRAEPRAAFLAGSRIVGENDQITPHVAPELAAPAPTASKKGTGQ